MLGLKKSEQGIMIVPPKYGKINSSNVLKQAQLFGNAFLSGYSDAEEKPVDEAQKKAMLEFLAGAGPKVTEIVAHKLVPKKATPQQEPEPAHNPAKRKIKL